jgi:hypothetical protein
MKKILLTVVLTVSFLLHFGQTYEPLLSQERVWGVMEITTCSVATTYYKIGGDTVIGLNTYHPVYWCRSDSTMTNWSPPGYFVREENGYVYRYDTEEHLIWNINLQVGDSVFTGGQIGGVDLYASVDTVDFINLGGSLHKRIVFNDWFQESWVEGVGSLSNPFFPFFNTFGTLMNELLCTRDSGVTVYLSPGYSDCFEFFIGIDDPRLNTPSVKIVPQPVETSSIIELNGFRELPERIEVYDSPGKLMRSLPVNGKKVRFEKTTLSAGLYFLRMIPVEIHPCPRILIR